MVSPTTTHVIEIETGIGEPAFIPLSMGQELQPISVGKKGMWRIESPRILDVHAFVYFDGNTLFLQSADPSSPASVDGYRIGTAWTELLAPCTIEIGAARFRFRALVGEGSERTETTPATTMLQSYEPATFPKADRPFRPGEFSTPEGVSESTRIAPSRPPRVGDATRMAPPQAGRLGTGAHPHVGRSPLENAGYTGEHASRPPAMQTGPFQPLLGPPAPSMPPGGYGSMTPDGVQQPPPPQSPGKGFVATLKQQSIPKVLAGVIFIIGAILYLAEEDDASPKKKPLAALDAGSSTPTEASSTASPLAPPVLTPPPPMAWPAGVPCPPPNWPPNTPLPCIPNGATTQDGNKPREPHGPTAATGGKTLERQAVDFVTAGEIAKAAAAYDELVRRDPNNKVYAEAARILRAKLDAGAP